MFTVVSYLKGIPAGNNNQEKPRVLNSFVDGVNVCGDRGIVSDESELIRSDVAVIQGYVHEDGKQAPHLRFRKSILDFQKSNGNRTIIVDSNLFLYKDLINDKKYCRLSYDGIFPNTGEYCYETPDPNRWEQLRKDLGMDLKPWRRNGDYILLCLQRNGGWSMRSLPVVDFFHSTIANLRKYTNRPIVVRTHPGDKKSVYYSRDLIGHNVTLSVNNSLIDDLSNAWATIVYNSSPSVASIIEGIPTFVLDPIHSQCASVANLDLSRIESPMMPDRELWIQRLAQCHWNDEDLRSGRTWEHMKKWAKKN